VGVKSGWRVGLTTLPPWIQAECPKMWEPQPPANSRASTACMGITLPYLYLCPRQSDLLCYAVFTFGRYWHYMAGFYPTDASTCYGVIPPLFHMLCRICTSGVWPSVHPTATTRVVAFPCSYHLEVR
jgi:hypothetical protein